MKCSLCISNFLKEISSLSHSIVFLYFFALITEEGFLISPCYSLELCIQMGISFLFSLAFFHPPISWYLPIPPRLSSQCHLFQEALIACCSGMLSFSGGSEHVRQCRRRGFNPWVRKIPWRRKWQPTPVFLPGISHGQRSLAGYSP